MRIPGRSKGSVSTQQTIDSTFGKLPVVMKNVLQAAVRAA